MSKPVQIIVIIVCIAGAGFMFYRTLTAKTEVDPPATYHFQCADQNCKEEWTWVAGGGTDSGVDPETCPKCHTEFALQCAKCPACGELHPVVGHGGAQKNCPHCGASMIPGQH